MEDTSRKTRLKLKFKTFVFYLLFIKFNFPFLKYFHPLLKELIVWFQIQLPYLTALLPCTRSGSLDLTCWISSFLIYKMKIILELLFKIAVRTKWDSPCKNTWRGSCHIIKSLNCYHYYINYYHKLSDRSENFLLSSNCK